MIDPDRITQDDLDEHVYDGLGSAGLRSRRAEFGTGATFKQKTLDGTEHIRSAITAAGGDHTKYSNLSSWDEESIRTVEDERERRLRE